MNLDFIVHGSKAHQERVRAALDLGHANKATRTNDAPAATPAPIPAPVGSRPELLTRLGLSDLDTSDTEILDALDSTLAAAKAKPVTPAASKAKRTQPDAAEAAYALAWGNSTTKTAPTPTVTPTAADNLYALAWGNDRKGA